MSRPNLGPRLEMIDGRPSIYIMWYEAGRQRRCSTHTTDPQDAEKSLYSFLRQRELAQKPLEPADCWQYQIASGLELYKRLHAPYTADPQRIEYAIAPLADYWGEKPVAAITKHSCREYAAWRSRAPATVRRELGALQASLNFAVAEGRLIRAPSVTLPERPDGKDIWLTQNEAARLLNAARSAYANVRQYLPLFILIGLYTGARKEAILSLRWSQVDLEARRIDFAPIGTRRTAKRAVRGQPIPRRLLTFLHIAKRRSSDLGYVVNDKGARIKDIGGAWDGVAPRGQGSFGGACKKAGLPHVTPHALRHTCGTWMAQRGVPVHLIGGWLGHTDARTTQLYVHHHPNHMREALAAADRR